MIAMGVGSLTELTGRTVNVALGSSSPVVVEQWHGRRSGADRARAGRVGHRGADAAGRGQGRAGRAGHQDPRVPAADRARPAAPLTIAAFGAGAVKVAARHADRMVINLVTPKSAARLVQMLHDECRAAGRPVPPVAAWVAAVVDPSPAGIEQLRRGLVAYMSAPGYGEMFAEAGFARRGRASPGPGRIRATCWPRSRPNRRPRVAARATSRRVRARLAEYADAGVDEIALVPGSSDADPAGVARYALAHARRWPGVDGARRHQAVGRNRGTASGRAGPGVPGQGLLERRHDRRAAARARRGSTATSRRSSTR